MRPLKRQIYIDQYFVNPRGLAAAFEGAIAWVGLAVLGLTAGVVFFTAVAGLEAGLIDFIWGPPGFDAGLMDFIWGPPGFDAALTGFSVGAVDVTAFFAGPVVVDFVSVIFFCAEADFPVVVNVFDGLGFGAE
jgi:hypothetical protein